MEALPTTLPDPTIDAGTPEPTQQQSVLLIDLENCPSQVNGLLEQLGTYDKVLICYAQSGAKVPLDWLPALSQTLNSGRLQIVRMPCSGKNAADFGISFFAGMLAQQYPDAGFTIVSNDTDLDHVVLLLQSLQRSAKRSGHKPPAPSSESTPAQTSAPVAAPSASAPAATATPTPTAGRTLGSFCAQMKLHAHNRPSKVESLLNALKSHFHQSEPLAQHVFKQLKQVGVIEVEGTKVTFDNLRLSEWAAG